MVSRGLDMAVCLLSIDDDEQLATEFRQSLFREKPLDATVEAAVSIDAQRIRRQDLPPTSHGRAEMMGKHMDFVDDSVPPTGPPEGWYQLWGGTYSNIYGGYVPQSVQRWGYVMWNEDRWDVPGGDGLLVKQWREDPDRAYDVMEDYDWTPGIY